MTGSGCRAPTTRTRGPRASNLAAAYQQAGRLSDAIVQYQQALADSERYFGVDHPMTRTVRENLAAASRTGSGRSR